jgi:hypothetical protein
VSKFCDVNTQLTAKKHRAILQLKSLSRFNLLSVRNRNSSKKSCAPSNETLGSSKTGMEESVPNDPNEVLFSFMTLQVSASGKVSFVVAGAVSLMIVAIAWRMVRH